MIKGLKVLERIKLQGFVFDDRHNPKDLEIIEKELRALEIIKEKEVNVYMLQWYFKHSSYKQYADAFERNCGDCDLPDTDDKPLTKQEYDSLKEVLL